MTVSDITSPTVLLTGPTSGIGAAMLDTLLAHSARPNLVLLARDRKALDLAVHRARTAGLRAHGVTVELGDLAAVQHALTALAEAVADGSMAPLDVVILNAGAQFTDRRRSSAQGHELTFAVNVIAQHALLRGIEPLLAPGAHVVLMGSSTHRGKKASFNLVPDPQWRSPELLSTPESPGAVRGRPAHEREKGGEAYATSKLALVTLAHDWSSRLADSGRRLNTYDPGLVPGTGLGKDMPAYRYWVWKRVMPAMRVLPGATTPATSGRRAVELAMGDRHADVNDGYVEIGRLTRAERVTFDAQRRAELWAWLEQAVADRSPRDARTVADEAA